MKVLTNVYDNIWSLMRFPSVTMFSPVARSRACVELAEGGRDERSGPAERRRLRRAWGKMIARIYEVDPLICECGAEMKIIALITEQRVVRQILGHLRRTGMQEGRGPPRYAA